MRVGPTRAVFIAAILAQVAPLLLLAAGLENNALNNKHDTDDRVGGFGRGVGQIDVSLGAHPSLLEGLPPRQQDEIPSFRRLNDSPPESNTPQPLDELHQQNPGSQQLRKSNAESQNQEERGYDCNALLLELSDDGVVLDIFQITTRLDENATSSWKNMLRDTILDCNDLIVKNEDCVRDKARLQGCNPLTLTNTSQVKPASRPETPANDAFELLKPQTASTPNTALPWNGVSQDRRFDVRRTTTIPTTLERKRNRYDPDLDQEQEESSPLDQPTNFRSGSTENNSREDKTIDDYRNVKTKGRMMNDAEPEKSTEDFETGEREEFVYVPSSTEVHEIIGRNEKPRKFHKD